MWREGRKKRKENKPSDFWMVINGCQKTSFKANKPNIRKLNKETGDKFVRKDISI